MILVVVAGGIVEVLGTVVVVMPGGIVLVEGEEVDVPGPIDMVVEEEREDEVVEEDEAAVVVVDETGDDVDDDVVEPYSQVEQGSKTFITIISANGHGLEKGP